MSNPYEPNPNQPPQNPYGSSAGNQNPYGGQPSSQGAGNADAGNSGTSGSYGGGAYSSSNYGSGSGGYLPQYQPGGTATGTGAPGEPNYGNGGFDIMGPNNTEKNGLGQWALICGIGTFFFGIFSGIPAIILGFLGVKAGNQGKANNKGMSIAGIVLGFFSVLMTLLGIILLSMGVFAGIIAGSGPEGTNTPTPSQSQGQQSDPSSAPTSEPNGGNNNAGGSGPEIAPDVTVAANAGPATISDTASPNTHAGEQGLLVEFTVTNNSGSSYDPGFISISCESPNGTCERIFDAANDAADLSLLDTMNNGDSGSFKAEFYAPGDLNDITITVSNQDGSVKFTS